MAIPLTQHQEPRISVNDLALYMVSSETARLGIIKRSKYLRSFGIAMSDR
jgi:hypothetical protein